MSIRMKIFVTVLLLGIFYGAVARIFPSGFFSMHDDTQVARVVTMGKALRNGQFPVRWVSDLGYGYGYPIFNFYGPLPYYVGGWAYSLGIDAISSTKLMFLAGIILSGFTMFFLMYEFSGLPAGLVAGTVYMYAPYHAVQIYIRGAVGEYYALIFLPLLALAILRIITGSKKSSFIVGSLGLAGVLLSHTIFGYVTCVFLIIFTLIYWVQSRLKSHNGAAVWDLLKIIAGGLALSAFFWLPAFFEMRYTNVAGQISATADFRDHFVCIGQLWDSAWGFGGSAPGCLEDGLSYKLGKLSLLAALVTLVLWAYRRPNNSIAQYVLVTALVFSLGSIFLMLPVSRSIWELVPYFAYIQYPWRFLSYANFGISMLIGGLFYFMGKDIHKQVLAAALVLSVIYVNGKYFRPELSYAVSPDDLEAPADIRWRASKISDEYLPPSFKRPDTSTGVMSATIPKGTTWSSKTEFDSETYSRYAIESSGQAEIIIQRAYFPGWRYAVNGKRQPLRLAEGLPVVKIENGHNILELKFQNTPVRTAANTISLLTLIGVLYFYHGRKSVT